MENPSPQPQPITLRPFRLSDVDDFMTWASDKRVTRFKLWEPYTSNEAALDLIQNFIIPHPWYRVVCLDGDRPVGMIRVRPEEEGSRRRASVAYCLAYEHWGKGICTETLRMVVGSIFKEWPELERLEALVDVANLASRRVLEKCGFVKECLMRKYEVVKGRTCDVVMYSLLDADVE